MTPPPRANHIAITAAAVSALLLWAAAPPIGAGPLVWLAVVPAAWAALALPGRAGRLAVPLAYALYLELLLLPALPFGVAAGQWGEVALPIMVADSPVIAVALVAVPALGALLYLLRFGSPPEPVAGGAERGVGRGRAAALAVLAPALTWTALELVRVKLDPGGLWGPLFASASGSPGDSLAALGGPWLLTFAVVLVNFGLAAAIVARRAMPALASIAALGVAALVGGLVAPAEEESGRGISVAAVQPGYDTSEEDRSELRHFEPGSYDRAALDTIADLAPLTREATSRGASLVVWPEAALYVDPNRVPEVRSRLGRLARAAGAPLVVPFFDYEERRSAVRAVLPDDGATLTTASPKRRPMWFLGEGADAASSRPLEVGGLSIGTMLGVDTQDPAVAAGLAGAGAELLTASTHDWAELAPTHRTLARTAAIASGMPLVRADWRYGSAVYGPSGEPIAEAGDELRRTVLIGEVPLAAAPTPYARIGDLVGWLAVLGALAALAIPRLPRATRRSPAPAPG
jgi:apolipoprotein N-acyltransferase